MLRSSLGLIDLREVFLTHYHADHYLGLPGMLKTFALRGREVPITIYGPPGLGELFGSLRRIFGKLTYPYELRRAPGRATALERDGYRLDDVPGRARRLVGRLRAGRGRAARALRRRARRRARRAVRARARRAPARRGGDARRRRDGHARAGARRAPPRPHGRDRRRHGADARPCSRRRAARTCSSTRRPSSRTSASAPGDRALDRRSTRRSSRGRPDVRMLALTHLSSRYFGPRGGARGAGRLPRDGRAEGLRYHRGRGSRSGAGRSLIKGGALPAPRRRSRSTPGEVPVPVAEESAR